MPAFNPNISNKEEQIQKIISYLKEMKNNKKEPSINLQNKTPK
jgi:hypothetical protein